MTREINVLWSTQMTSPELHGGRRQLTSKVVFEWATAHPKMAMIPEGYTDAPER